MPIEDCDYAICRQAGRRYQIFAFRCKHFNNIEIEAHHLCSRYKRFLRILREKL
jgi:hypothetical protein